MRITHRLDIFTPKYIAAFVLIAIALLGVTVASTTFATSNEQPEATNGQHLITVHDDGTERAFLTSASTLREAFAEAGFTVSDEDLVEPSIDEELVAPSYQVNVYRARPVIVQDGNNIVRVLTPYQTARQIAQDAGMEIREEDELNLATERNSLHYQAMMHLTVTRAKQVKFTIYGKKEVVYTQEKTVGGLLKDKAITLGKDDSLSKSTSMSIVDGMTLELWRNGKQTLTEEEPIKYSVKRILDVNRDVGYKDVRTKGVDGKQTVTYEIVMKNGKELSRKKIQAVVITKPTEQVEVVGAKMQSFGGTCSTWISGAGISDVNNANWLIAKESHCNPYAVNPYSGACGVAQELPCGKSGCSLGDGACQVRWMNGYVLGRYGSWANAVAHSQKYGWY